jgi:hypothetical protein
LLELGAHFAIGGQQFRVRVGGRDSKKCAGPETSPSLQFVAAAFATEEMSRFLSAFVLAASWFITSGDVPASIAATDNLLGGRFVHLFLICGHYQVTLEWLPMTRINYPDRPARSISHRDCSCIVSSIGTSET